jgi:hypothetical protein
MGALIPLALALAPEIARWLSGATAETTTSSIAKAIQTATGTSDPDAAGAVLQRDPSIATQLRVQLAQIAAEQERAANATDLSALIAAYSDAANARNQTIALSSQKSAIAWSAPVISGLVLVTFTAVMTLVLTCGVPAGSETAANMLLGTLAAMATSVVSYWVGSSAGSARKDEQLAQNARTAAS